MTPKSTHILFRWWAAVMVCLLVASCNSDKNLKKGDQYWAIGEFYEASLQYAKAYAKTPAKEKDKRGMIAYKVAESNRRMNYFAKAQAGYRNAVRYHYTDTTTYFYLAEMERYNKEYKQAAIHYQLYLDAHPGHRLSQMGLQSCATAQEMKQKGSDYTVKEDKNFNSNYADYSPAFNGDDIYFSSTRRDCNGDDVNGITGMKSGDIFFMQKDDKGKWKRYEQVGEAVNSKYDEGACAFSPDGKSMYFTRCRWDATYPRMAEIYCSQRSDADWGEPKLCELAHDTLSSYAHPAVSPDGQFLYFVSDMPGGMGGLDIWRAPISGGSFGPVENMGPDINTDGDEMFPTFRPNGHLYFSSNGRGGMGGLDIYRAAFDSTKNHWEVLHLPSPVNSNGDDFGMTFEGELNQGYFSSNRTNRRGWDKIYSFYCPEIIQTVKGWVYEQDGYELPQAVVYMVGDDGTNKKATIMLDGSFEEVVKPGVKYIFLATCDGYMNYTQELKIEPSLQSQEHVLQFPLPSLNIPVLVRNVFYEFDKAAITPQSIPALQGLTNLLKQNPSIAIELSSHCDYRGSAEYNLRLSQARAEAVVDYLIKHGIEKGRVVAKGYGKTRPKVITKKFAELYKFLQPGDTLTEAFIQKLKPAEQDTCNALNRRTEFSVLNTTYGLVDSNGKVDTAAVNKTQNAADNTKKADNGTAKATNGNAKAASATKTAQPAPAKGNSASTKNNPAPAKKDSASASGAVAKSKAAAPSNAKNDTTAANVKAQSANTKAQSAAATPKTGNATPKTDSTTLKSAAATPKTGNEKAKSAQTTPKSDKTKDTTTQQKTKSAQAKAKSAKQNSASEPKFSVRKRASAPKTPKTNRK